MNYPWIPRLRLWLEASCLSSARRLNDETKWLWQMKPSVCPCQIPFRLHRVMFPPTPASVVIFFYHRALCEMSTESGMLIAILSTLPPSSRTFSDSGVSTQTQKIIKRSDQIKETKHTQINPPWFVWLTQHLHLHDLRWDMAQTTNRWWLCRRLVLMLT